MASLSNLLVNVPKLRGRENYDEWAFAAENYLILEGLDKRIKQEGTAAEELSEDIKTKAKLIMTIDPSLYVHIKGVKTTKALWEKLRAMFDDSGFTRRISLLRNLISVRYENCESMTAYVTQIIETSQKLSGTGFNINDEWVGSLLLAGLPEKYSPMIMAIEHSGINITADAIKTKLLDLEVSTGSESGTENAFAARNFRHTQKRNVNSSTSFPRRQNANVNVKMTGDKEIKCYNCKQTGHFKSKCPFKVQLVSKNTHKNAFNAVFLNGSFSKEDWYIDSGASYHMSARNDWMKNLSSNGQISHIWVANNNKVAVECCGEVEITTLSNGKECDIVVRDVLFIPNLATNLLSVSQMIKNGNTISFLDNACHIYNSKNELVATATLENGIYKLDLSANTDYLPVTAAAITNRTWHRRMAHINNHDLNIMKNGAVEGVDFAKEDNIDMSMCKVCCEGKSARLPFSHKGTRSSETLDVIHADVCGPMEQKSIGGSKYFIIFVDDYSRMVFIYFLKGKDEALDKFMEFKNMAENQKNKRIKVFRSDNGKEFCNKAFDNYLKKNGIIHQTTNPYTPEQNGLSERLNRTLVEKARCLLFDANLPKRFWAEATHTAVYLRNRSIASGLDNKTPYEVWTGVKPNLEHIRIFGSKVMVHVPKERRLKWDKKSTQQILVGYPDNVKGYRVYNPEKGTISTSRNVMVFENTEEKYDSKKYAQMFTENTVNMENKEEEKEKITENKEENDSEKHEEEETVIRSSESSSKEEYQDVGEQIEPEFPVLRTKRERKPPVRFGYGNMGISEEKVQDDDFLTYAEAMSGPEREHWKKATEEELQSFKDNEAWQLVDAPENGTLVKCKWVFKKKYEVDNKVRYRARLVAKGYTQVAGVDYEETYSPVVRHSTLRLLFALSVKLGLSVSHLDVTTAFLNGNLKENIYMEKPEGYTVENCNDKVLLLRKAIYGLKQSSRAWYERVDDCLTKEGFKKSQLEPCLYTKMYNDVKVMIALYVDDFFVFSNSELETSKITNVLSKNFKIKDLGQLRQCLGMRVTIDKDKNVIKLDQEQYIEKLLNKFNMVNCKLADTPMETKINLEKANVCDKQYPYQRLLGSLMYLAVLTRPDIGYPVSFLSQYNNCFDQTHWKHAKRILKYLKKTKSYCIKYSSEETELQCYVDADWASNILDRKSFTGYCFKMCGSVISWQTKKQTTVALSSTEAEYMAISEACREAIYLRKLYSILTGNLPVINIYNDSQSAQKLLQNQMLHGRSKHIDVRYHFVKDLANNDVVKINYLETENMPADILTKCLPAIKHYYLLKKLGIES